MLARLSTGAMIAAAAGAACAQDWVQTSGPSGAFITAIGGAPAEVYAGTWQGSVYRSINAGVSWVNATKNLPAGKITALLVDGTDAFAGVRDSGLWRTQDHGGSWSNISPMTPPSTINGLVAANGNLLALSQGGSTITLFISPDHGQSWNPVTVPTVFLVIASDGSTIYGGAPLGIYRSANNGATWTLGSSGLEFITDHIAPAGPVILTSANHHMFRSTNGGSTWQPAATGLPTGYRVETLATIGTTAFTGMQVYPNYGVYRTTDGGLSWQPADNGLPQGLDRFPQSMGSMGSTLLLGTPSMLFRTTDAGANWTDATAGIIAGNTVALSAAGATLFAAVANTGRVFRTGDAGANWTSSGTGITSGSQIFSIHAGTSVFAGTDRFGIFRSGDGGQSFAPVNAGIPQYNGTAGMQYREIAAIAPHGGMFFAGTGTGTEFFNAVFNISGGGVIRSSDGGTTWQAVNNGFPIIATNSFSEPVYDPVMCLFDTGPALLAATFQRGVARTVTQGGSWAPANAGLPTNGGGQLPEFLGFCADGPMILGAAAGFANGGVGGTGIFRSDDGGQSWVRFDAGIPAERPVNSIVSDGAALYASVGFSLAPAAPDGMYRSLDHGQTWAPFGPSLEGNSCGATAFVGSTPFVAATARGVWKLNACYANCDSSTTPPVLNIQDFGCFLNRFAAGESYANCDGSSTPPVLNVQDFGCFLNRFASGCP